MKTKYESEPWFPETECISAKDALKISLTETLETMLVCKDSPSRFELRYVYEMVNK